MRTLALVAALLATLGCGRGARRDEPATITNTADDDPRSARCEAIPPPAAVGADCASSGPRNSDGSSKQLAPPAPGQPGKWLVLDYDAFGPQAMANELIGMEWWSWDGGGSWEMCDAFDVHVVVYNDDDRARVAELYPTVEGKSDNRLVSRTDAIRFLDAQIAEVATDPEFRALQQSLERTRATIIACLR